MPGSDPMSLDEIRTLGQRLDDGEFDQVETLALIRRLELAVEAQAEARARELVAVARERFPDEPGLRWTWLSLRLEGIAADPHRHEVARVLRRILAEGPSDAG